MAKKKNFGIRLSHDTHLAIRAVQQLFTCTQPQAFIALLTDGVGGILSKGSIDSYFLKGKTPDQLCSMLWQYADALLNDGTGSYYLAEPPCEGFWAKKGITGRAVLHRSARFTESGISYRQEDSEKYPEVPAWLREDQA